jgi:membrane protein implicated in regulation of membrane protease activity
MVISIPWWAWAICAAVVALGELHTPGIYLIWFGLGAALTAAAAAAWHLDVAHQLAIFAPACVLSCALGFFVYRMTRYPSGPPLNQRDRLMIGCRGTVAVPLVNGQGKVRLGDTVWLAEGPNLPQGAPVVVKTVRGSRVVVEPAGSAEHGD